MELQPVARRAVSDTVYGQLISQILAGAIPAGEAMPSERELAEAFQVNRHAVREALKRVQQAGLILISQGGKTRVLDWRSSVGLEALSALVAAGVVPPAQILGDVAVMRRTIGADAARMCAARGTDAQLESVAQAGRDYPEGGGQGADLPFWTAVVDGSNNLAYRLALNTLVAAIDDIGAAMIADLGAAELGDAAAHRELADAICSRDAERAYRLADQLLSRIVVALDTTEGK